MTVLFYALVFLTGILSMGFQIVASRELAPSFGSSVVVWSFLISTFLIAFSAGSFAGGIVATKSRAQIAIAQWILGAGAVGGFALNAFSRRRLLEWLETNVESFNLGLLLSCAILFLAPVLALTAFTPLCVQFHSRTRRDRSSGHAAGVIYGVSTLGNIGGVMIAALLLVPHYSLSTILTVWTFITAAVLVGLCWLLRSA
jgi:hypothetical protein